MNGRQTHAGEALAWLGLGLANELQPRDAFALVEALGSVEAVVRAPARVLEAAGAPAAAASAIPGALGRAETEAEPLAAPGATLAACNDAA